MLKNHKGGQSKQQPKTNQIILLQIQDKEKLNKITSENMSNK